MSDDAEADAIYEQRDADDWAFSERYDLLQGLIDRMLMSATAAEAGAIGARRRWFRVGLLCKADGLRLAASYVREAM